MGSDSLKPISIARIAAGELMKEANQAIQEIARSVLADSGRPGARIVTIKIEIKPNVEGDKVIPTVGYSIGVTLPKSKGLSSRAFIRTTDGGGSELFVDEDDPGRSDQNQQVLFRVPNAPEAD